jgi:uncharacterized membrane protein
MLEILHHLFGAVCGQNPVHTWAPGGLLLPCCQRCLGLYAGAGIAALLHLWLRPPLTGRFLEVHGGFLLLMAPFGFHWLPQGPVLRTVTGLLFGFGLFAFLWLPISRRFADGAPFRARPSRPNASYAIGVALTVVLAPLLAACGGRGIAYALSGLVFFGLAVLAAVICGNFALALSGAVQWVRRRSQLRHQQ